MRIAFALLAAIAIFLSGIHAGPAQANESDPVHATTDHAVPDDDGSSTQPDTGDQHGCHHHCPSVASSDQSEAADYFASARLFPTDMAPLTSTSRIPPLNPPKA